MADIVERLRDRDNPNYWTREVREEAADEIERLRSANTKDAAAVILNHSAFIHNNALELAAKKADGFANYGAIAAPIAAAIRALKTAT